MRAARSITAAAGRMTRTSRSAATTAVVRTRSRQVVLGQTFTDWMRRLGFRTISYGPRGSATLIRDQLDRLLACEWMIRWDNPAATGEREFGIKEIKLTNEYVATDGRRGTFQREIMMAEGFFAHLREHAVPLNEHAIRQLRDSPTAIDLYTWLAYRLPRISGKRPVTLSWQQLAVHFGNDGHNIRKFRQTVRDAWERHVSAVYPEARAEFDTTVVRLFPSPAPLQQKPVAGARLKLVTDDEGALAREASARSTAFLSALAGIVGDVTFRAWFRDAVLSETSEGWRLRMKTRFQCDYINQHFDLVLERAAAASGIADVRAEVRTA